MASYTISITISRADSLLLRRLCIWLHIVDSLPFSLRLKLLTRFHLVILPSRFQISSTSEYIVYVYPDVMYIRKIGFSTYIMYSWQATYNLSVIHFSYVIYLFMSFIKDTICMNILHQMMHRHWYDKHYVHHLPMKVRYVVSSIYICTWSTQLNQICLTFYFVLALPPQEVSNINYTFFDIEDMMLENSVAPALILLLKFCMDPTKTPIIDMFSYILLLHNDANSHSICPYTVGFFFPPLDAILSPTVSHTLHHALNMGHYTIWPLHQLKGIYQYDNRSKSNVDGSLAKDWATYNRVFKTDFPEGRGVKVEWTR